MSINTKAKIKGANPTMFNQNRLGNKALAEAIYAHAKKNGYRVRGTKAGHKKFHLISVDLPSMQSKKKGNMGLDPQISFIVRDGMVGAFFEIETVTMDEVDLESTETCAGIPLRRGIERLCDKVGAPAKMKKTALAFIDTLVG